MRRRLGVLEKQRRLSRVAGSSVWLSIALVGVSVFAGARLCASADVNGDGSVDVLDVQGTVNLLLSVQIPSWVGQGDVDGSSQVDVVDVQALVGVILRLPQTLWVTGGTTVPPAPQGISYSHRLVAAGGTAPYAWALESSMPPGLTLTSDGRIIGAPPTLGSFSTSITVVDSLGARVSRTLTMEVIPPPMPPVANPDSYTVSIGKVLTVPAPGYLANDTDPNGDPLVGAINSLPSHGSVLGAPDGSFVYTPSATTPGVDSFTYHVSDGTFTSIGTVTISIIPNQPPIAIDDHFLIPVNGMLPLLETILMANDSDPDNDPLTLTFVVAPEFGEIVPHSSGEPAYQPYPGFTGLDSFQYEITDGVDTARAWCVIQVSGHGPEGIRMATTRMLPPRVTAGTPSTLRVMLWEPIVAPAVAPVPPTTTDYIRRGGSASSLPLLPVLTAPGSVLVYEAVVDTTGASPGLIQCDATLWFADEWHLGTGAALLVHEVPVALVGPGQTLGSLSAAFLAHPNGGTFLLTNGNHSSGGNTDLNPPAGTVILGADSFLGSIIHCGGFSFLNASGLGGSLTASGIRVRGSLAGAIHTARPLVLHRCLFVDNMISQSAQLTNTSAGITVNGTSAHLADCVFASNRLTADFTGTTNIHYTERAMGAAVLMIAALSSDFSNCSFIDNSSSVVGFGVGGAVCYTGLNSLPTVHHHVRGCNFSANELLSSNRSYGGAIGASGSSPVTIRSSQFYANHALAGAAYAPVGEGAPSNQSESRGGATSFELVSLAQFAYCDFEGNTAKANIAHGGSQHFTTVHFTATRVRVWDSLAQSGSSPEGGGLRLWNWCYGRIEHSLIRDCMTLGAGSGIRGGGISSSRGILELFRVEIAGNRSRSGGGMVSRDRSVLITDQCFIHSNTADTSIGPSFVSVSQGQGGGIAFSERSSMHLMNTVVSNNQILGPNVSGGGGIGIGAGMEIHSSVSQSYVTIENCLFSDNDAGTGYGGGISDTSYGLTAAIVKVVNTTVVNNTAASAPGLAMSYTAATVNNCLVWGNVGNAHSTGPVFNIHLLDGEFSNTCVPQLSYSVGGSVSPIALLTQDPLFTVGPFGAYYLQSNSPCIDAGISTHIGTLVADLSVLASGTPDIGPPDLGFHWRSPTAPIVRRNFTDPIALMSQLYANSPMPSFVPLPSAALAP